jgi:hypothetical protein
MVWGGGGGAAYRRAAIRVPASRMNLCAPREDAVAISGSSRSTGHRLGDFAHTHRTSGLTRPYATLWSACKGDEGAARVTMPMPL